MKNYTTIFGILMLLSLLTDSIYARTIEYEAKRDTTLDIEIYFDRNTREINKDYMENSRTMALLDSLLVNPVHAEYLNSITLASPASKDGNAEHGISLARERCEKVKALLCGKYPNVSPSIVNIREGKEYWSALRELITADLAVPDREDVLALMDYHYNNPVKMQNFLQHLDAGIPYRYISSKLLPKLRRTEIKISLTYPEAAAEKKATTDLATVIQATEFTPIDQETAIVAAAEPVIVQTLPQKEVMLVTEEKTQPAIKPEKKKAKEHKEKQKKGSKEKVAGKNDTEDDNTVLALKNNLLYDLALAPNIEIEIPIGRRWSVNAEYKCPWWSMSSKEICYQLLSGGLESRFWLGDRRLRNRLTGHFVGVYAEGGIYDFQFKGDGYQGKYYGAAGLSYGYSRQVSQHLAFEFSLGIGYLTTEYQKYTPYEESLVWMSSGKYTFIGPTKAKISLVWLITKRR